MTTPQVLLCADSMMLRYPEMIGLAGEQVEQEPWIKVATDAHSARSFLQDLPGMDEVWVLGSNNMEAVNLAAALKADSMRAAEDGLAEVRTVRLVSDEVAQKDSAVRAAGLDDTLTVSLFAAEYYRRKAGLPVRSGGTVAAPRKSAVIIPVVSASGGVGKTTVVALMAAAAVRLGKRTLLIDADMQFGDVADMVHGMSKGLLTASFEDFLSGRVAGSDEQLSIVGSLKAPEHAEECPEAFAGALDAVVHDYDVIVIDTGTWWNEVQACLIERAAQVVYLLDQRPSAIRKAARALALCGTCGLPTGAFRLVLNKCARGSLYSAVDITCALSGYQVSELADGGSEVEELTATGRADDLFTAYNPLAQDVMQLTRSLVLGEDAVEDEAGGLFAGLKQACGKLFGGARKDEPCPF